MLTKLPGLTLERSVDLQSVPLREAHGHSASEAGYRICVDGSIGLAG